MIFSLCMLFAFAGYIVGKSHTPQPVIFKIEADDKAIELLKQCVNYDGKDMTTAISGELGDRIKEFIRRCE